MKKLLDTLADYLVYSALWFKRFYHCEHVALMGGILSGKVGISLLERIEDKLSSLPAAVAGGKLQFHLPRGLDPVYSQAIAASMLSRS